jgi:hypothetical protein
MTGVLDELGLTELVTSITGLSAIGAGTDDGRGTGQRLDWQRLTLMTGRYARDLMLRSCVHNEFVGDV